MQCSPFTSGSAFQPLVDLFHTGLGFSAAESPQEASLQLVNGLDAIARELKGKACILLDVDRQRIIPFGTPDEIDAHLRACIETLGSPTGGLGLICGLYPGTPVENIDALCTAIERYEGYWVDKQ